MNKLKFFAALCCAAAVFAACEKNDPKDGSNEAATGIENGHDWVNLGLPSGTKWATCNVGASKPEEYGNYYAWGETTPKDSYPWETYKYGTNYDTLTKYNNSSDYGIVDNIFTLEAADDAATVNWGGAWRMPTYTEWVELCNNCTWTWTDDYNGTGAAGHKVVSNTNGNSIFLPAAGFYYDDEQYGAGKYGEYWSGSLYTSSPNAAWYTTFFSDEIFRSGEERCLGQSVRPVLK